MAVVARLHKEYNDKIRKDLVKQFGYKNAMQIPKLQKITINIGLGEATKDGKVIDAAVKDLTAIAGQKVVVTKAKKSIASFKLRQGAPIGCMVTLRNKRMYEFLDRLVNIALPKIRDFRGLNAKSFDGSGNITFGLKEQIIFPEIEFDKIDKVRGMNITFVTSAKNAEEGRALIAGFNMPFYNVETKSE
ncbi:MAG TPA: 50S ribosomal protein L5 [Alphaproteobacteria bacterium]|nr:50S ribosomal protein L5 [Alphaproteobacteria bacterium]